jgi:hypothetical protein
VVRQPDEAFSTLTGLRKRGRTFQTAVQGGGGVARSRARQVGSDGLREVAIAQRMPDAAEFCLAFRGMMPDPHHGEAFSPLALSRLSAGQGPTPTSVGIHYGPSERTAAVFFSSNGPGGSRGSGEQVTPDHVGSYFEPAPANCCAVSKRGLGAGHATFSPIALVAVPICAGPNPPRGPNPPWWRSAKNEAVLKQLVNVLTRRCRGTR